MEKITNLFASNLANAITAGSLIITVFLVVLLVLDSDRIGMILILSGLIGFADLLDGFLARKFRIESDFGRILDPVRDKIFIISLAVFLIINLRKMALGSHLFFTFFLGAVALILEVLIASLALRFYFKRALVLPNKAGKIKMGLLCAVVLLGLLSVYFERELNLAVLNKSIFLIDFLLMLAIVFSVKSIIGYWQKYFLKVKYKTAA